MTLEFIKINQLSFALDVLQVLDNVTTGFSMPVSHLLLLVGCNVHTILFDVRIVHTRHRHEQKHASLNVCISCR